MSKSRIFLIYQYYFLNIKKYFYYFLELNLQFNLQFLYEVFMVTGGYASSSALDSNEMFDRDLGSWTTSGAKLPRPMRGLRAANIDDRVIIFGNYSLLIITENRNTIIAGGYYDYDDQFYDDILEYDPDEDSMVHLGHLTQARAYHTVSVVQAQDYTKWCQ